MAKMIFYKNVKHTDGCDPERIHTYWIKTTMLWMCERYPCDSGVWSEKCYVDTVRLIYQQLHDYIRNWHLPHFFVANDDVKPGDTGDATRWSILKPHDKGALKVKLLHKISHIITNTEAYIPRSSTISRIVSKCNSILRKMLHDTSDDS